MNESKHEEVGLEKNPSIVKSSIFYVNVKKKIQIFFKYHYKIIMNFIKFIISCITSYKDFYIKKQM
jgi:hypothetical protein